jgi:hypothetical protein
VDKKKRGANEVIVVQNMTMGKNLVRIWDELKTPQKLKAEKKYIPNSKW